MATPTRIRQAKQARNSESYDDTRSSGSGMESSPNNLEEDLNNLRSQLKRIIDTSGNWYDDPDSDIKTLAASGYSRYFGQTLVGTIDGTNVTFTTSDKFTHDAHTKEALFYNGMRLFEGAGFDYAVSESVPGTGYDTITFSVAPVTNDLIQIDYSVF